MDELLPRMGEAGGFPGRVSDFLPCLINRANLRSTVADGDLGSCRDAPNLSSPGTLLVMERCL